MIALGLEADRLNGTAFIRSLERAGLGGRRDHFFHSFQNYFFGLIVLASQTERFGIYKDAAHLHWQVDPFGVWFLCAMWHDVGYAHEKIESIIASAYGDHLDETAASKIRTEFVEQPKTKHGIRSVASLMGRLLDPTTARTEWTEPSKYTIN